MNFFDTYEITRSATPNAEQLDREEPTLNEELNQVIGQLGRFWGGFRKQSQQALETARKDFGDVVVQAQKELSKLTVGDETPKASTSEHREGEATPVDNNENDESSGSTEEPNTSTSTSRETLTGGSIDNSGSSTAQSFFSRLQASLPPNIVSTVQNHIPESIKHVSETIDLGQLRSTLVTDFQHVQGVTRAQAEEYFHKSEALLREAVKEAGEALKEAVKVIPPEEGSKSTTGMVWDGSDVWMLPYDNEPDGEGAVGRLPSSSRPAAEQLTVAAVATRAEVLLKRLKHDPSILRHDPGEEDAVKADFFSWREKEVDSRESGIEGTEWSGKIATALEDPVDGQALKELEENLVPAEMTKTAFWLRFFYRSHQIRTEGEKRKALIQSTTETEDDFSWEDDEDESSPGNRSSAAAPVGSDDTKLGIPPTEALLRAEPSRRVSSSDSFDLVSAASASASVSVVGDSEKIPKGKPEEEEDGDSDWE